MNDQNLPQTVESSFRAYANFAGIHQFKFDTLYVLGSSGWSTENVDLDFNVNSSRIIIDATAASAGWKQVQQSTLLPSSVLVKYHKTQHRQGVFITKSDGSAYLIGTDSSGHPVVQKATDQVTFVTVLSIPKTTPIEADVELAYRQIRFSDSESDLWHTFSLYMNGALVCTYVEKLSDVPAAQVQIGMAAYGGDGVTYTDISVPQITEFAETSTLDPSEFAMGGLQRAIEGRYLKFFIRFDGSLRAWKPRAVESVHTFSKGEVLTLDEPYDNRNLYTHVRQVGAYTQAEFVRSDLIRQHGHRFVEQNNPYLMTEADCFEQARLSILRMESEALTQEFTCPITPLVEPEDRITTPDGDWIMEERQIRLLGLKIEQQITARSYTEVGA